MSSKPPSKGSNLALRLTRMYTFFLALTFMLLFGVSYTVVDRIVQSRDREIIEALVEKFTTLYRHGGTQALAGYFSQPIEHTDPVFVRIVDRYCRIHFITASHPHWKQLDRQTLQTGRQPGDSHWEILSKADAGTSWLVGTQALSADYFLQVGRSNAESQKVLKHMRNTGLIILLPMLIISLAGGFMITQSALAPLRTLVKTIREIIDTGDIKKRVPQPAQRGELAILSAQFNQMLTHIDQLVNNSKETLDNVAHDLRTPMTHLRNSAEHVLQHPEASPEQMREALADSMEESERILKMLNALMDLAEARTGGMRMVYESVSLRELVDEVIELYAILAEESGLTLKNEVPTYMTLEADRLKLRQCISNLTDNALKYSPAGTITFHGASEEEDIILSVEDQGIGIPADELERIWDRLYRAEQSRAATGLGLGLSMVKALVEAHGGTVAVQSQPGRGATFSLRLPKHGAQP
jgi:signal transduction histidine kinase